jgi:hypothetical protein
VTLSGHRISPQNRQFAHRRPPSPHSPRLKQTAGGATVADPKTGCGGRRRGGHGPAGGGDGGGPERGGVRGVTEAGAGAWSTLDS